MSNKKLRIVHYPQIGAKPFEVEAGNLQEARLLYNTLADYDLFHYENRIKPDYANTTVVEEWSEEDKEWVGWSDDKTGIDDINEYFEFIKEEER
ncbi:hypothetical protein SAMN04487895_101576 [Paenibacillus sophorae]|uniref:Uncharacterized protein n=1 Tax=Paenibacillus sophorae TaxID=1333845 RepID=A0A1H8GM90_9BACL|nr:hypothetical protein [Paenibacillus sophorae]QWU14279.1 hypothetical protein KP014_20445 [Paenibacillus sophorae]SEN45271.1 hypothetical protein SAMN04487895_101576 [Paenibacillus sophorae]